MGANEQQNHISRHAIVGRPNPRPQALGQPYGVACMASLPAPITQPRHRPGEDDPAACLERRPPFPFAIPSIYYSWFYLHCTHGHTHLSHLLRSPARFAMARRRVPSAGFAHPYSSFTPPLRRPPSYPIFCRLIPCPHVLSMSFSQIIVICSVRART